VPTYSTLHYISMGSMCAYVQHTTFYVYILCVPTDTQCDDAQNTFLHCSLFMYTRKQMHISRSGSIFFLFMCQHVSTQQETPTLETSPCHLQTSRSITTFHHSHCRSSRRDIPHTQGTGNCI